MSFEKTGVEQVEVQDEKPAAGIKEINVASVALASAVVAQKQSSWTPNKLKLYAILAIGYLISTMNGYGMWCNHEI